MTERHTQAEDDILVQRRNHTNTSKVCGAPSTAPHNCCSGSTRKEGRERSARERENERDALARWRSVGKQYAKENAHTAQCATSMDIRKRKTAISFHLSYLPTFLPTYLPSFLPTYPPSFLFTYLSTNLFTSLLLFQPHLVAAHYLPTHPPTYLWWPQSIFFVFFLFFMFSYAFQ